MATPSYPVPSTTTPVPAVTPEIVTPIPEEASAAFEKIEPELATLSAEDLIRPTLDIERAVPVALGAAIKLKAHREVIVKELPWFPIAKVDHLKDYALASFYAHMLAFPLSAPDSAIEPLIQEGVPLRERLFAMADALVTFGVFSAARIAELRGGTGHLDMAGDLIALSALFREHWPAIGARMLLSRAEVDRAQQVGTSILLALGPRSHAGGEVPVTVEAADRRLRAFTLFVHAYDACRRAIAFVRWEEGDAESIVPSLFTSRRPRRTSKNDVAVAPSPEPTVVAPSSAAVVSDD